VKQIQEKIHKVSSKESFIEFVKSLANADKTKWENSNLDKYLNAISEYTEDIDGFYKNLSNSHLNSSFDELKESYGEVDMEKVFNDLPPVAWRVFADILRGSVGQSVFA